MISGLIIGVSTTGFTVGDKDAFCDNDNSGSAGKVWNASNIASPQPLRKFLR